MGTGLAPVPPLPDEVSVFAEDPQSQEFTLHYYQDKRKDLCMYCLKTLMINNPKNPQHPVKSCRYDSKTLKYVCKFAKT